MKKIIKIASIKGHFIDHLNKFLEKIGLEEKIDKKDKKLQHIFSFNEEYDISIVLLRWQDMKDHAKKFDFLIFGSDQWLESGLKSIIILDSFKQGNCNISLMSKNGKFSPDENVATSFPNITSSYVGISPKNIKYLSGSVEAASYLGIADQIVDIVESGLSSKANGFTKVEELMSISAVIGTTHLNKIEIFKKLITSNQGKKISIAFDGNDGSGKSTLSKHFVMNGINNLPSVLVAPYSGYVAITSKSFLKNNDPKSWFINIGFNHWRPNYNVNAIYDRNILTGLTELIDLYSVDEIKKIVKTWEPLPDIIFYCAPSENTVIERVESRLEKDEFDKKSSLLKYHVLYEKAYNFVKNEMNITIHKIDTDEHINSNINKIKSFCNFLTK